MNKTPTDGENRKKTSQQKRKSAGGSAQKNPEKNRAQKTPQKGKKPVGRPTPSPNAKERRSEPLKRKTDSQKQQRPQQKRRPPPQNRRKKPVPPEENTSSKLKIKREPKRRTMKQSEADAAAEEMLERPPRRTDENTAAVRPLIRPKQPVSPRMRKIKRILLGVCTIIILVAVCIILSMTVFFKIEEITVEGKSRYDKDDIIASSMINIGDNLFLCNTSPGAEKIKKDFAYIEEVQIEKKLFNKINITVTEAKPASIIESDGKFIVLSKSGKIVEISDEKKYNVPTVLGAKLENVKLASRIQYKDSNLKKYLDRILNCLSDLEMDDVITVDISDTSNITLVKENGFKIIIGNFEDIEYKLKTAKYILNKSVKNQSNGTLDVSLASSDGGKSYLKTGTETSENSKEESTKSSGSSSDKKNNSDKTEESSKSEEESSEFETTDTAEPEYTDNDEYIEWAEPEDGGYEDTYQDEEYYEPEDYGGDDYYEPEDQDVDDYYESEYTDTGYEE